MNKFFLYFITSFLFTWSEALPNDSIPHVMSLKTAVEIAITNNLNVKQAGLSYDAAKIYKRQARMNMMPDLNAGIGHGINTGRSIDPFTNNYINQQVNFANYSLGSSVVVFNGLTLQHRVKQNALTEKATDMEWQQAKEAVMLNVILSYLQILTAEEQLKASLSQAEVSRKQVKRLEILNDQGAIIPSLLYDLQGQVANDELAIVNNQNNIYAAIMSLCQLMNIPFNRDLKVEPLSLEQMMVADEMLPEQIYAEARQSLSVIKATNLRKQAAAESVKAARGAYYPQLYVNANIYTSYSSAASRDILLNTVETPSSDFVNVGGTKFSVIKQHGNYTTEKISYNSQFSNNYNNSINLGLRIPLFNGLQTRNQVELAKIDLKDAGYVAEASDILLNQQVEQAYLNMTATLDRYNILSEQVKSFSASFRAAETRFNAGVSNQVEYLIAKNNLDRTNINLINARYDYVLRLKILDYFKGKLIL